MPSRPRRRRRLVLAVLAALTVLVGGGGLAVLLLGGGEQGDVVNTDVEFRDEAPEAPPVRAPASEGPSAFNWPVYGFTKARTQYLPVDKPLRPPFERRWKLGGKILLEFPPVLGARSMYLLKNNAALYALARQTGKVRWKTKLGHLAASSPAVAHNTVYSVILERGKGIRKGRVVAVSAKDGRTRWSRKLPSRAESSPLLHRGSLYFGTENGTVYALDASDGSVEWTAKAAGAVKGALALEGDRLFMADYGGAVQALRLRDGKRLWRTETRGGRFGLSAGNFYSTPAVAFGRVYVGNTDGGVYSFSARTGKLAWRKETGGFVYSSPAVAEVPGTRPTVYIGSYDKKLYALDARTGRPRWTKNVGGRISGGVTVIGDLVFSSTLEGRTTAVTARSGRTIWRFGRGKFNPVVSTGRGLFVMGSTSMFAFDGRPGSTSGDAPKARPLTAAERRRVIGRRVARRKQAQARALARRVAARRAAVARRNDLRRRGVRFCFRSDGRRVCRVPEPLVCVRDADGRTTCRARRPVVCFTDADGRKVCRARRG